MYCHQYFLVVSMIWLSYTDKLYIKMMGYPWKIDWNHDNQHSLFKIQRKQWKWHGCTCNMFLFLFLSTGKPNQAEQLQSVCWHFTAGWAYRQQSRFCFTKQFPDELLNFGSLCERWRINGRKIPKATALLESLCTVHCLPASVPCLRTEKAGNVFLNGVSRRRTPFTVNKRARLSVRSNVRQSFSKRAKEKPIF